MDDRELLWKAFEKELELYKFYLEVALKLSVFVFGITGAIISYYLAHAAAGPWTRWALVLPLIMNCGFGFVCWRGIEPARRLAENHRQRGKDLQMAGGGLDFDALPRVLKVFTLLYLLVAVAVAVLVAVGG